MQVTTEAGSPGVRTRIEGGEPLELANAASREVFRPFLPTRHVIEAAFTRALAEDACHDFHSFTRLRLDLFYDLDARGGAEG